MTTEKIMAGKIKGFIGRLVMGSEKSEEYARASLPSNRWELFWDILKGRFSKLIIINLLTFMFFLPVVAVVIIRTMFFISYGIDSPFGQPFGVGFQGLESLAGIAEGMTLSLNARFYAFLPIACAIAGLGIAGGAYVIRNMVWTEGIFVSNDFWRGIKQNGLRLMLVGFIYGIVVFAINMSVSSANQMLASEAGTSWLLVVSKVVAYFVLAFYTIMTMHMITMVVTYNVKIRQMFKNAFLFTVGLLPQNIFFGAGALVPFVLVFFGGTIQMVGFIVMLFISIAWALLVWTDYSQWVYDNMLDAKTRGMEKNKGMYEKIKNSDSEALKQYKEQMFVRSSLNSRPIKPITDDELKLAELPTSFSREDIEKLNESRKAIYDDHARYVEEHKNDPEFAPSEEELEMNKAKTEREKRIEKAKRELEKRDKKKK